MNRRSRSRADDARRSRGYRCDVDRERENPDVLPDDLDRRAADFDQQRQSFQPVVHQHDAGFFNRDVRSGQTHRDADIGAGERRGVIDAVADHRHAQLLPFQPLDQFDFLLWQQIGMNLVNTGGACDAAGDALTVAGQHHRAYNARVMKMMNRVASVIAYTILHADDSLRHAVLSHDDRRMAFQFERVERGFDGLANLNLPGFHHPAIAGDDAAAIRARFDTEAWIDLELIGFRDGQAARASFFNDQLCDGVLGALFGQSGHLQQVVLRMAVE